MTHLEKQKMSRSADGAWSVVPNNFEWVKVSQLYNGWLIGSPYNWWTGVAENQLSRDAGKTWLPTKKGQWGILSKPQIEYVFADQSIMIFSPDSNYNFFTGWTEKTSVPLERFSKGGARAILANVPAGCNRIKPELSLDNSLFLLCRDGQMYVSENGGKSFTLDFDPTLTSATTNAISDKHLQQLKASGELERYVNSLKLGADETNAPMNE